MKDLTYETVALEQPSEHLLVVRFNRPEVRNAISTQVGRDMLDLFARFQAPTDIRCIVLTGTGDKAFCAGGDLKERHGMTDAQWLAQHAIFERMTLAILDCPIPVIAAVNGAAFGGGLELALTCDFVYASTAARFALTEITLGIMPGGGGTQFLPRAAGCVAPRRSSSPASRSPRRRRSTGASSNKLCAPEKLMEETLATAQAICDNAPISVRQAKRSMHFGAHMDIRSALFFEVDAYNKMVGTEDRHEGVRAFNEKRKPRFKGK